MSTELEPTEAVGQLLSCLEILMEEVDFHRDTEEWFKIDESIRHKVTPPKRPTQTELHTAMWQVTELAVALLEDHLTLVQVIEAAEAAADEHAKVGEIIRPQLIVPGQS